jgi:hypothetical protein
MTADIALKFSILFIKSEKTKVIKKKNQKEVVDIKKNCIFAVSK